jgi:hypothetical protein
MKWIKHMIADIIVTAYIIIAVNVNLEWIKIVLIVYTIPILLLKTVIYFGGSSFLTKKHSSKKAPEWIIHLLYGINVFVLLIYQWWFVGMLWIIIWLFSWLFQKKAVKQSSKRKVHGSKFKK